MKGFADTRTVVAAIVYHIYTYNDDKIISRCVVNSLPELITEMNKLREHYHKGNCNYTGIKVDAFAANIPVEVTYFDFILTE